MRASLVRHSLWVRYFLSALALAALASAAHAQRLEHVQRLDLAQRLSQAHPPARAHAMPPLDSILPTPHARSSVRPPYVMTDLADFTGGGGNNGLTPSSPPVLVSGLYYGVTSGGGTNGRGSVYSFNPSTGAITNLASFSGPPAGVGGTGEFPSGTLAVVGGVIYGTAQEGGAYGLGDVFSFDPATNALTDVANFNSPSSGSGFAGNGDQPSGGLIAVGSVLYGVAEFGGANGAGNVFSYNTATRTLSDLADFSSASNSATGGYNAGGNGAEPVSTLANVGGLLYGVATAGGANDDGDVFSFDTSHPQNGIADVADFTTPVGTITGGSNTGALQDIGGTLYGAAAQGGANSSGFLYAVTPGTNAVTDLADFTTPVVNGISQGGGNGATPSGALINVGGVLYGVAEFGGDGPNDGGDVYSFDTNTPQSGITDVADFNYNIGDAPTVGLVSAGGGLFYGTDTGGGPTVNYNASDGTVYSFNLNTDAITPIAGFDLPLTGVSGNGKNPAAGLTPVGSLLYGSAQYGGANGGGDIFTYTPATGQFADVYDFYTVYGEPADTLLNDGGILYGSVGFYSSIAGLGYGQDASGFQSGVGCSFNTATNSLYQPSGGSVFYNFPGEYPPVYSSTPVRVGSLLYGTTYYGGANNDGEVFSLDPSTNNVSDLADFNVTNGQDPGLGGLTPVGNLLYGTTEFGGAHNTGEVFSFDPSTNALTDLADFTSVYNRTTQNYAGGNGGFPNAALVNIGGVLYGTTEYGGADGLGDVFSFDTNNPGNGITDLADFNGTSGNSPQANLINVGGVLYGTAEYGGANGYGDVFSFDPAHPQNSITDIADCVGNPQNIGGTGTYPIAPLTEFDGALYGTAGGGGANGYGTLFRLDAVTATTTAFAIAPSPAEAGRPVTFRATVTPQSGTAAPTGTVTFTLNGTAQTPVTLTSGAATFTTTLLAGTYTVSAAYSGDSLFDASTAAPQTLTVNAATGPAVLATFSPGLQMVALDEAYSSLASAFDLSGSTAPPAYDTWNGSNYVLSSSAAEAAPAPGTGFWIAPSSSLSVYDTGALPTGAVTVSLARGWNLIGNPSGSPLSLSTISVTGSGQTVTGIVNANAALLLYATLYTWGPTNTTGYTPVDGTAAGASLQPFTGYWLYAFQPCTATLAVLSPPQAPTF